jgi:UDPglucose 6-dehydrogenase
MGGKVKKIGIVGYGYVGKAMAKLFEKNYEVLIYDVTPGIITDSARHHLVSKDEINNCDLGVICVPTPRGNDGSCDTSYVETVLGWLTTPHILLKSTVAVGTTDRLVSHTGKKIVFSPEYCGESTYWTPYAFHTEIKETPFFIFGGDRKECSKMIDFFMPVTGPTKTYRMTDARTAEMVKYMENTFYATKIAYCYEIDQVCKLMDVDYNEARDLWLLDPRINPMHTAVFEGNDRPFGGKCLPKDLSALVETSSALGYEARLLREVLDTNDRIAELRAVAREEAK